MKRNDLLKKLLPVLKDVLVVCNIGIPSQELYALEDRNNHFYMLGSMGLCSPIGMGLSMSTGSPVVAIEGDGAVLMNMGALATLAHNAPENFTLLIVDNGSYGSTGDQKTFTDGVTSLAAVARGAGCRNVVECKGEQAAVEVAKALESDAMTIIVARVASGNEKVGAIPLHPIVIRERFKAVIAQQKH